MTQTVLGPKGSPRRRWTLLLPLVAAFAFGILYITGAQAVNATGAFELEGNAVSTTGDAGTGADDWDRVCREVVGSDCSTTATTQTTAPKSIARSWVDATSSLEIYTGGGSKDFNDPEADWLWKPKDTVPDKDTILHSFAARYSLPKDASTCPAPAADTTCEVVFFGSDRFDNAGDSQLGFWFFQNKVLTTQTSSQGGFKFSGHHKIGDLLVISDFSNGGTTSTIKVYSWQPTICTKADSGSEDAVPVGGCPSKNLRLESKSTNANCATSAATANACGIVNAAEETSPWPFLDKTGHTSFQQGEFYEAGLNLSGLGFGGECFASVLAESRSSDSTSAVLKDFVLSNFGECNATLATQVSNAGPVTPGTAVHDTLTVTSSVPTVTASGTVTWFLCGPIASGACSSGGTNIGTGTLSGSNGVATADSPDVNTAASPKGPGRYCFRAEWPGDLNFTAGPYSEFGGTNGTNECFTVKDTTAITTAQKWLPQDTASITTGSGGSAPSGTVVFSLYNNGTCSGSAAATFSDSTSPYETNNTTYLTASSIISWSATFTPDDTNGYTGSTTTRCERSDLTIDNSASDFPPGP